MPQGVGQVGGTNFVALDTNFGDKPLGRLGNRTVQSQDAPGVRDGGQANAPQKSAFKRIADRVIDALTPQGVRSEGKFRRGLEETSRTTGNILGGLASGNTGAVRSGMASIRSDASPVTSRGKSFDEVLTARLDVHVNKLSTAELVKVAQGAQKGVALPDGQAADFQKIANHVTTAAKKRLVEEAVASTKASILDQLTAPKAPPQNPSAQTGFTAGPAEVHGNAIDGSGLWPNGTFTAPKVGLVKAALAEVQPDQRQAFLASMSHDELQAMRANGDDFGRDTDDVNLDIEIAIANKRDTTREGLLVKLNNLESQMQALSKKPAELLTLMKAMDNDLSAYRKMNEDVIDIDGPLSRMTNALYATNIDKAELAKLSAADFAALKKLVEAHAPGHATETMTNELNARIARMTDDVARGLETAFERLDKGDTIGFLKAFARNLEAQEKGVQDIATLRGKDVGADDRQDFRDKVVKAMIGNMALSLDGLEAFQAKILSDDVAPIFEWLGLTGAGLATSETDIGVLGMQMYPMFANVWQEVAEQIGNAKGEEPKIYDTFDERTPLTDTARRGLAAMGVRIENGEPVVATVFARIDNDPAEGQRYQADLRTMVTGEAAALNNTVPVSNNFSLDLNRGGRKEGVYQIDVGNGPEELIPADRKPIDSATSDELSTIANTRLLALFGNDQTHVTSITKVIHQGMLGYMQEALVKPDNALIRDENGTGLSFLGTAFDQNSMTVSRDVDGSARIRLSYHNEPLFIWPDGDAARQTDNAKGLNASWDVEVIVKKDGTIDVDRFGRSHNVF